jgi:hypothetical protein
MLSPNLGVISSFFNKEVVSTSSSLSTQTLSFWTEALPNICLSAHLWRYILENHFLFFGLHHGSVMLVLWSFWNTGFLNASYRFDHYSIS